MANVLTIPLLRICILLYFNVLMYIFDFKNWLQRYSFFSFFLMIKKTFSIFDAQKVNQ